ncbi:MAG: MarR family winged helix-turn-helix transcriptional regulator [Gammaproteobacteria bacterium]
MPAKSAPPRKTAPRDNPELLEIERAWLALVRRSTQPRMHADILAAAGVTLDRSAYPILTVLDEQGALTVTALAEALGLDTSTLSRQVRVLEKRGLVARTKGANDARMWMMNLTRAGATVMEKIRGARHNMLAATLAHLSRTEIRALNKALSQLVVALAIR